MERSDRSVDDYLASLEGDDAELMATLDGVISEAMPGRSRTLWEGVFWGGTEQTIIGYRDIVQHRPRGNDVEWFLVGLARQKKHVSLYINAVEDGDYLGKKYADRLGKVKLGSASIGFAKLDDIDLDQLAELCAHADRITE